MINFRNDLQLDFSEETRDLLKPIERQDRWKLPAETYCYSVPRIICDCSLRFKLRISND